MAGLRLLAKFHDIGKVSIPDSILKKPSKLTGEEMPVMRRHCEVGYRIAKSSPDLDPIAVDGVILTPSRTYLMPGLAKIKA